MYFEYFYFESTTIRHYTRPSGFFSLLCRKLGGVKNIFGGVNILFRGVITNIWGGSAPPQKIRLWK